jgi:toxin ParE1/3/4
LTARVRFHPAAQDELREATLYYETARPALGDEFRLEVEAYVERASTRELPGTRAGSRRGHALRKLFLHRFPYALVFELRDDECIVWAVAHTSRRPGFWRSRI